MKKYINIKLIGLIFLVAVFASCEKAEQDMSPIATPNDSYPLVTGLTLDNAGAVTEGDTLIYTLSINKPIDRSLTFTPVVDAASTTLEEGVDFDIYGAAIDPYKTETKIMVITYSDAAYEEAKAISFTVTVNSLAEKYLLNTSNVFPSVTTTVGNLVSDNLVLEFHWAMDVELFGSTYSTSNNVDFDIFYSDAAGFDINNPWATFNGTSYAATGDEPEVITITPGLLPDGDYVFWFDFWSNGFYGYGLTADVPVTTWAYKPGTLLNYEITQAAGDGIVNLGMPGFADVPEEPETNGGLVRVNISGTTYTVSDFAGTVVGTGKSAVDRTPRPNLVMSK